MTNDPLLIAYRQGYEAFINNKPESSVKFYEMSEEWSSWKRGWNTARHGALLSANKHS